LRIPAFVIHRLNAATFAWSLSGSRDYRGNENYQGQACEAYSGTERTDEGSIHMWLCQIVVPDGAARMVVPLSQRKNAAHTSSLHANKKKQIIIKRKISIYVKVFRVIYGLGPLMGPNFNRSRFRITLFVLLLLALNLGAQERKVDPTWLHRYVPNIQETQVPFSTATCHYKAIFGQGADDNLLTISRFGEVRVEPHGSCGTLFLDREEQVYFVLSGKATLRYNGQPYPMRTNDFTYIPPAASHAFENKSDEPVTIFVAGFKISAKMQVKAPSPQLKISNMDELKEETVSGHPDSVLYKLLVGSGTGTRDAIDSAYVLTSFFWMDFAPGGTNFPHHHETAEEIYLVVDGEGDMVAGAGMDGVEGRYPAKAGDSYYFRPNCTVGFYNQNKPGAKAHILAVRSRVSFPESED
jgi:mannose-6-phosphate isomerase-like protein (cupin superfamily)